MFSTSYRDEGLKDIITGIVKLYKPKVAVDLGTQQGSSAILIANNMSEDGHVYTFDLFEQTYAAPPFAETHADFGKARYNVDSTGLRYKVDIFQKDAYTVHQLFTWTDLLHIDICNHYNNVKPLLLQWVDKVTKVILLEGGYLNHWQYKHGFTPPAEMFDEPFLRDYNKMIFSCGDDGLSVLIRK